MQYLYFHLIFLTGNHSCVPNAEVQFPHNCHKLQVVALENIAPGEVIKFVIIYD